MDVDTRCGGVRRLCTQYTEIHFLPRIQRLVLCCQPQMMKREVVIAEYCPLGINICFNGRNFNILDTCCFHLQGKLFVCPENERSRFQNLYKYVSGCITLYSRRQSRLWESQNSVSCFFLRCGIPVVYQLHCRNKCGQHSTHLTIYTCTLY